MPRRKNKLTYQQVLQAAQQLPPRDQLRLHDELAKQTGIYLMRPAGTALAARQGQRLAKQLQRQLAGSLGASLDEVMTSLRGCPFLEKIPEK